MANITQKIIAAHLANSKDIPNSGENVAIKIDQTLTQDATGTMAYLQFENLGIPAVKTELSVSYVDHNTLQEDFKNADDHRYLQSIAAKYGLWFSPAGSGICHQVHLERFGAPGKTLLGSDSHTPTGGALGMLAIGAGGLDIALAMAGKPWTTQMPAVIGVNLSGKLGGGAQAKDIILELLRRETVKGGVGCVYEYFGQGAAELTVPQRATITNMGAELGATSSVFPSDEQTKAFLSAQGRLKDWREIKADANAAYDRIINVNLDDLCPLAACPHSPDNVKAVAELSGIAVDQVIIGSCTNSSIEDLASAAGIIRGKTVHKDVQAGLACGSRATLLACEKAGILTDFIRAGFRILECACGPCIGMGFAPKSGGVSLRTFNRNFKGRSGTADAGIYLVSPETAAASAIAGFIRSSESVHAPLFVQDNDCSLIPPLPAHAAAAQEIERGPNIKRCPQSLPLDDAFTVPVLLKTGDNITTDDIMPAGAKVLPFRSNIPEISKFVFHSIDPEFYERAVSAKHGVVIGGNNYGQGSSREHAALAPMFLGVKALIAKSFARIHKANLINYGILPLVFVDPFDYESIKQGDLLEFTGLHSILDSNSPNTLSLSVNNKTQGTAFTLRLDIGLNERKILKAGGAINAE
ncbi:MAG: aconitate hydratase [Spirochaetaceae bacterium]|jgi:aconitate hydratase|nr:aconitate hydratase [Spirochaetaceae bacterium]